jgi:hypothetical protein
MMEELKPEGIPAEGDTIAQNQIVAAPTEEPTEMQQEQASVKELNFRAIRDAADRASRERDDALRRLQEYEARYAQPTQTQEPEPVEESDIELNVKEDDLVEGKHIKKMVAHIKKLEAQQKAFLKKTYETSAEARIRAQYSDFDKVMTIENMQALSKTYPELAKSINASSDLYDKAVSAYTLIKKFGIYEDEPYAAEKERAVSNSMKPKPLASISPQQGDTPLSRANAFANGLTDDLKRKLREEMAAASKKY